MARDTMLPWIQARCPLEGKRVLEFGCGQGAVTLALAELGAEVLAVDISEEQVALARKWLGLAEAEGVELGCHPPEALLGAVRERGPFDVVLFYAVLEHMTVAERLEALEAAGELTAPGGAIVACETPNRLVRYDWHSSFLPFFAQLPDELALRCRESVQRPEFREEVDSIETLQRFGRGVSFHEFELVFGDLGTRVLSSSYEPELAAERPVHAEELALARLLEREYPQLPAAFSRYWLDLVLSPEPASPPPAVRPWTMETTISQAVGWTAGDALSLAAPESILNVQLPVPTRRLVVAAEAEPATWDVEVRLPGTGAAVKRTLTRPEEGAGWASFELPESAAGLHVAMSHPGLITFVGYEA